MAATTGLPVRRPRWQGSIHPLRGPPMPSMQSPGSFPRLSSRPVLPPFASTHHRPPVMMRPAKCPVTAPARLRSSLRPCRTLFVSAARPKDPQLGDYPELPWQSSQSLPPRGWWDQQMRRNFGDPVPEYEEVLSMWGPDISVVPPRTALLHFTLAASAFVGFGFLCKSALVPERPAVPREYPFSGLVKELGGLDDNKAREESEDVLED